MNKIKIKKKKGGDVNITEGGRTGKVHRTPSQPIKHWLW
jgi:hypothetical protein